MAHHRSGSGALALNSRLHRRRRALTKRHLRHARADASIDTRGGSQEVVIGPGGMMNLQPVATVSVGMNTERYYASDTSNPPSVTRNSQEGQTSVHFGSSTFQTQSTIANRLVEPTQPSVQASLDSSISHAELNAPDPTEHPTSQVAPSHPSSTPTVMSLVVSPVSASLPPLLSNHPSIHNTLSASPTVESTSAITPSDSSESTSPLSQNPPIIVGILMVVLLGIAAMVALVSWLTRSSRRRRRDRMESRNAGGTDSRRTSIETGSSSFKEKGAEEGINHHDQSRENDIESNTLFYVEPHSTIFNHENYPADKDLYNSMRTPDGAYLHSPPPSNVPYYQEATFTNKALHQGDSWVPPRPRGSRKSSWEDAPAFLNLDEDDPHMPANTDPVAQPKQEILPPITSDVHIPNSPCTNEPNQAVPSPGFSWATALRSNLVSAFDVVKHAAGERVAPGPSAPDLPETSASPKDRFTPLALRPARMSLAHFPLRRSTQDDLTFGGVRASKEMKASSTSSSSRMGSEDGKDVENKHAIAIGGLGRFSFEQRMRTNQPRHGNSQFQRKTGSRLTVHSTALSRRRSGMASGSGSSSNSATSSEPAGDATMRKRRPG